MIKFFRKIRQNLLFEGKTGSSGEASAKAGKYLKYAIGETLLIMIGILMALQLQNWNEARKQDNQFKATLEQLYTTIKYDSETFFRQSMSFERDIEQIDILLDSPDSIPAKSLPFTLYNLLYNVQATSSESIYYANNLNYDPDIQEQKELAKELVNYIQC